MEHPLNMLRCNKVRRILGVLKMFVCASYYMLLKLVKTLTNILSKKVPGHLVWMYITM